MIPVPFLDVVIDVGILSQLIPEINARFGLALNRSVCLILQPNRCTGMNCVNAESSFPVWWWHVQQSKIFEQCCSESDHKASHKIHSTRWSTGSCEPRLFCHEKIAEAHVEDCYRTAKIFSKTDCSKQINFPSHFYPQTFQNSGRLICLKLL